MGKDIYSSSSKSRRQQAQPPRRKKKKKSKAPVVISVMLIVLSVLAIAVVGLWNSRFFVNETDGSAAGLDDAIGNENDKVINFLVVGIDSDQGRESNQLTDTILVASFDVPENRVSVLQIPRDTYIGSDLTSTGKINALYASGPNEYKGIDGLAQYVYDNFRIPIDHYATITMEGFRNAIDGIGGVTVDVPKAIDLDGVILEPGVQTLDGNQAEKFVRQRKGAGYSRGDIDRLEMQRVFMASFVKQFLGTSKAKIASMLPGLSSQMTTDMSVGEMVSIASKASKLSSENINFFMVPGEGTSVNTKAYGNQSVYSIHKDLLTDMINEHFRTGTTQITSDQIGVPEIKNSTDIYDDVGGNVNDIIGSE